MEHSVYSQSPLDYAQSLASGDLGELFLHSERRLDKAM